MARRQLYLGQPTGSAAAVYTSTNQLTTVTAATVFNGTAGAVTLDLWTVPDGDTAADDTKLYEALSVAAGETKGLPFLVGHTLGRGESIFAQASAGASLTVRISGDVVS